MDQPLLFLTVNVTESRIVETSEDPHSVISETTKVVESGTTGWRTDLLLTKVVG
jgi:hypothetical protein